MAEVNVFSRHAREHATAEALVLGADGAELLNAARLHHRASHPPDREKLKELQWENFESKYG